MDLKSRFVIYIIVAVILAIAQVKWVVVPAKEEYAEHMQTASVLQQQLNHTRTSINDRQNQFNREHVKPVNNQRMIADINQLAEINGLTLRASDYSIQKQRLITQFTARELDVVRFIAVLSHQVLPFHLIHYDFKQSGEHIGVSFEWLASGIDVPVVLNRQGRKLVHHFFCNNDIDLMQGEGVASAHYSVKSLRMAAMLAFSHQKQALVIWPDGSEQEIQIGSLLGSEKAEVVRIKPNSIELQFNNHQHYQLHM